MCVEPAKKSVQIKKGLFQSSLLLKVKGKGLGRRMKVGENLSSEEPEGPWYCKLGMQSRQREMAFN